MSLLGALQTGLNQRAALALFSSSESLQIARGLVINGCLPVREIFEGKFEEGDIASLIREIEAALGQVAQDAGYSLTEGAISIFPVADDWNGHLKLVVTDDSLPNPSASLVAEVMSIVQARYDALGGALRALAGALSPA